MSAIQATPPANYLPGTSLSAVLLVGFNEDSQSTWSHRYEFN